MSERRPLNAFTPENASVNDQKRLQIKRTRKSRILDYWFILVQLGALQMPQKDSKRLSITLEQDDYERLQKMARAQRPKLTLQYIINFAIKRLLEEEAPPKLGLSQAKKKTNDHER